MNQVLICVPTCNRPEMVKDVLTNEMLYYSQYPMDLCYYDSSINDDTKQVIDQFNKENNLHIFYKRMSPELCLDYKLVEILRIVEESDYDYIWLVNDSISITKDALDVVFPLLAEGYDLIRLPLAGDGELSDLICRDAVEWFHKCSQGMAHMASTIMNTSLLKEAPHDWDYLKARYIRNNELDYKHGYFFMVAFYLEQILKLKEFKGIFIGNHIKWRWDSPLKREQIYWREHVFQAWAKSYVDTIMLLPERYTEKEKVIKCSDNIVPGRFSRSMLIRYRLKGLYSFPVFLRYRKYFPLVTNVRIKTCFAISCIPAFILRILYGKYDIEESMWETRLQDIMKVIKDKNIIVYGAGLYGERVVKKLMEDDRQGQVICIAVTDKAKSVLNIEDIEVRTIDELLGYRKNAAVIIATLPAAACAIRKILKRKKFKYYYALLGY